MRPKSKDELIAAANQKFAELWEEIAKIE